MKGFDKINMVYGIIATAGAAVFGEFWVLFVGFFLLNVIDYFTGWTKAKFFKKNESSKIGAKGILKKVGYWIVIGVAFAIAFLFIYIGQVLTIDLTFVQFFGWFTLATYLVNELRSILENLVEMNVKVPMFLITGLEVTEKILETKTQDICPEEEEENHE